MAMPITRILVMIYGLWFMVYGYVYEYGYDYDYAYGYAYVHA